MQELARLEQTVEPWQSIRRRLDDSALLIEMAQGEDDPEAYAAEVRTELDRVTGDWERLEIADILSGPHDAAPALLEINAGAGGTEACDWVSMLLRMYLRWAE